MNDFLDFLPTLIKWIPALGDLLSSLVNGSDESVKAEVEAILNADLKTLHDKVEALDDLEEPQP